MNRFPMTDREPSRMGIRFTVGRDVAGRWIVSDRDGRVGGVFSDRASAVHFAMFESEHTPGAVWCLPEHVILDQSPAQDGRSLGPATKVAGRA
jgi:hypothetical protein